MRFLGCIVFVSLLLLAGLYGTGMRNSPNVPMHHPKSVILSQSDDPIVIGSNPELAQFSTGGVGTRSDPYLIGGKNILSSGTCIVIRDTTAFFKIIDCELECETILVPVIQLSNVENGFVEDCYVRGGYSGIEIRNSIDCGISSSRIIAALFGISFISTTNCSISTSHIANNGIGSTMTGAENSLLTNNSIYRNSDRGVNIELGSDNNSIYMNKIGWNGYGHYIEWDGQQPVGRWNAVDNGENTSFTDGISTGNAWSDFNASEVYEIPGSGLTTDPWATRLNDTTSPTIDQPLDMIFDVDTDGETVTWNPQDEYPYSYTLIIDRAPYEPEIWDGQAITINLDFLQAGEHEFVMNVTDAAGNVASDRVIISAVSFVLGGIGTELVMWASAVTVVSFLALLVIIKRFS